MRLATGVSPPGLLIHHDVTQLGVVLSYSSRLDLMDHTLGVEVSDFLPRRHAVQALIVGHDELHVSQ